MDPNPYVIEHYGVKGMRWGHRKVEDPAAATLRSQERQLKKTQKKINNLDMNQAVAGLSLQGWGIQKAHKKTLRDPNFNFNKLTPEQKQKYRQKANRRVARSIVLRGVAEAGVILGAGAVATRTLPLSPSTKAGAQLGTLMLAGQVGYMRAQDLNNLRVGIKFQKLSAQRDNLRKAVEQAPKK